MTEMSPQRQALSRRLKRIEGQVRGLIRMLDEDRYCIDILQQIQAAKAALKKVETELLRDHARICIEDALQEGSKGDQHEKVWELIDLFERGR